MHFCRISTLENSIGQNNVNYCSRIDYGAHPKTDDFIIDTNMIECGIKLAFTWFDPIQWAHILLLLFEDFTVIRSNDGMKYWINWCLDSMQCISLCDYWLISFNGYDDQFHSTHMYFGCWQNNQSIPLNWNELSNIVCRCAYSLFHQCSKWNQPTNEPNRTEPHRTKSTNIMWKHCIVRAINNQIWVDFMKLVWILLIHWF